MVRVPVAALACALCLVIGMILGFALPDRPIQPGLNGALGRFPDSGCRMRCECSPKPAGAQRPADTASSTTRRESVPRERMLGDILEAVDAPLPAEANGRVWGRIVDELGTAVAGAEVVIWLETQGRTDYPNRENFNSDGDFLAADAIFRARQWKTWSRLRRKARTDSEGAFEFGGIAGTRCSLQLPEGLQRAGRNNSTISWSVSVGEFNLIQVTRVFAVRLTLSAPELAANTQCIVNCEPEDPLLDSVSSHASSGRELKLLLPRGRWSITPYCHVPRL